MPRAHVPQWDAHPLIAHEQRTYDKMCKCSQRIEAGRAELHRTLESVLVIDMRFTWNGIGNSLTRWLAVLRLGTAAGRATFLWFSDRQLASYDARQASNAAAAAASKQQRLPGRRLRQFRLESWRRTHVRQRTSGFDLGDYFTAIDADYRWSRAAYRRVRDAMAARNVSSPLLINYRCVRHTWACMEPMLEFAPLGPPARGDPGALDGAFAHEPERVSCTHENEKDGYMVSWLASRTEPWLLLRLNEQTALEPSGPAAAAVLSGAWPATLADTRAAPSPGTEASASSAAAASFWSTLAAKSLGGRGDAAGTGAAGGAFWHGRRYATHACGACLTTSGKPDPECIVDLQSSRGNWRPSNKPTNPEELKAYQSAKASTPGVRALRHLRRGPRYNAFATACETYGVLRPRRWLQRAMLPQLRKVLAASKGGPIVGLHLRSGFADWQFYSSTQQRHPSALGAGGKAGGGTAVRAKSEWSAALSAGPMSYDAHWRTFESMLYDCKEDVSVRNPTLPCFNWRTPVSGRAPGLEHAAMCAASRLDGKVSRLARDHPGEKVHAMRKAGFEVGKAHLGRRDAQGWRQCLRVGGMSDACMWSLPMPSNGTLAAVLECTHRFARSIAAPAPTADEEPWGVFAMGDAPGFMSLVHSQPGLATRVAHTNDAGGVAHTTFTSSCPQNSDACLQKGTVDPQGGWTRAMIDYYVGGLSDAFVSSLFSSFVGAVLRRSLTCCKERYHFGAMYSQQRSHRDKPMRNVDFLRALMQTSESKVRAEEWE